MVMKEAPIFFENEKYRLFGVLYHPADPVKKEAFVFVDAFAEEKLWSQRVMVSCARQLASRGYAVLRFDVMGHGDSEGDFEDATVESNIADIVCASAYLRNQFAHVDSVGLLGLRYGATLAMITASRLSDSPPLILWEPIVDGEKYVKELLRSNLVTQTAVWKVIRFTRDDLIEQMKQGKTVTIDGYQITYDFYLQLSAMNLSAAAADYRGDVLIVQISGAKAKARKEYVELAERLSTFAVSVAEEEQFWKEIKSYYPAADNVYDATLNWLGER
jgi:uncharacterized protein